MLRDNRWFCLRFQAEDPENFELFIGYLDNEHEASRFPFDPQAQCYSVDYPIDEYLLWSNTDEGRDHWSDLNDTFNYFHPSIVHPSIVNEEFDTTLT
jgi:hypothetical protein